MNSVDCADKYSPYDLSDDGFSPQELSSFCCEEGVKIRLVPRFAVVGEISFAWMGPSANRYKILVFIDGSVMTTHGVAITVSSQMSTNQPGFEILVCTLQVRRQQQYMARKISTWWRSYLKANKFGETSLNSTPEIPTLRRFGSKETSCEGWPQPNKWASVFGFNSRNKNIASK